MNFMQLIKITSFPSLFKPRTQYMLGRWSITHHQVMIDIRIDQANEDHCGCCVVPIVPITVSPATTFSKNDDEYQMDYYVPYVTSSFY